MTMWWMLHQPGIRNTVRSWSRLPSTTHGQVQQREYMHPEQLFTSFAHLILEGREICYNRSLIPAIRLLMMESLPEQVLSFSLLDIKRCTHILVIECLHHLVPSSFVWSSTPWCLIQTLIDIPAPICGEYWFLSVFTIISLPLSSCKSSLWLDEARPQNKGILNVGYWPTQIRLRLQHYRSVYIDFKGFRCPTTA